MNQNINLEQMQDPLFTRLQQEQSVTDALNTEILSKLNINIENMPKTCQQLLTQFAILQTATSLDQLEIPAISLQQTKNLSEKLDDELELLKLKQHNERLQAKIERNKKFLEEMRHELELSKKSLKEQNPNPDNIQEYVKQLKMKVASYEESCDKAKSKFNKLQLPDSIMPYQIKNMIEVAAKLKEEENELRINAEEVSFDRQARDTLLRLRR